MSDVRKGAKKSKNDRDKGISRTGRQQIKPELVTSGLIAGLYALFLIETIWESGPIALVFSVFLFVVLVLMAYFVRSGTLEGQRQFKSLIYVFVGLAALSMIGELLRYLNIFNAPGAGDYWAGIMGVLNAIISIVIIAAIIYMEKDELKKLHIGLGDKKAIGLGAIGFLLCILAALAGAYLIFGGNTISQDKLMRIAASVIVFGILSGIVEELWFRGLLLSRITPLLGESQGNIYQAAVFGVFETVMFYTITGQATYLPVFFIIGAFTGYYWGRATQKANSMVAPMLLHAGLYILLLLPIMVGLSS